MVLRWNAVGGATIVVVVLVLAGCSTETVPTTSTATTVAQPAASQPAEAATSSLPTGPRPFPDSAVLEPGEYVTTRLEPRVQFRIEQKHPLTSFQNAENAGLENIHNACINCVTQGTKPHRGIAVHTWWLPFTPEEIIAELDELEAVDFGSTTQIEVAGFPATQFEGTAPQVIPLWEDRFDDIGSWWLHADQRVRFIIVETPAGSMLITISAHIDEFDDFLPSAEEILAGISFPDLD